MSLAKWMEVSAYFIRQHGNSALPASVVMSKLLSPNHPRGLVLLLASAEARAQQLHRAMIGPIQFLRITLAKSLINVPCHLNCRKSLTPNRTDTLN